MQSVSSQKSLNFCNSDCIYEYGVYYTHAHMNSLRLEISERLTRKLLKYEFFLFTKFRKIQTELSFFFFLNCFWWNRSPYYFTLSSAAPQRTAYSEVPSQMAAHLRTGSPLQAGEIAGFEPRTAVLQSGITSNELPLLPAFLTSYENIKKKQNVHILNLI